MRLAYGEHLRRSRAVAASRAQLEAALEAFEGMGARPWAERARNELRATAETRSRAHCAGPAALTPREREVAQLAVAGLSNKQIGEQLRLSARTVGAHLRHIFQKLGVATRVALRDALGPVTAERHGQANAVAVRELRDSRSGLEVGPAEVGEVPQQIGVRREAGRRDLAV